MSQAAQDPKKHFELSQAKLQQITEMVLEGVVEAGNQLSGLHPAIISLDLRSGKVTVEVSESENAGSQKPESCAKSESAVATGESTIDQQRVQKLQARLDDLLAGRVKASPSGEDNRIFAPFVPDDKIRGSALAGLCEKIADRIGGVEGLEAAVDRLYEGLNHTPFGTAQYAAKLFLTHYKPARQLLLIRSLEERQPQAVLPSGLPMGPR